MAAAMRQLHVRRLDDQRQTLQRDGLVAPVELVGFAGRKAQRHKGVRRRPSLLVAPRFGETMHAVMRAIVTAASQLFEQYGGGGRAASVPIGTDEVWDISAKSARACRRSKTLGCASAPSNCQYRLSSCRVRADDYELSLSHELIKTE